MEVANPPSFFSKNFVPTQF